MKGRGAYEHRTPTKGASVGESFRSTSPLPGGVCSQKATPVTGRGQAYTQLSEKSLTHPQFRTPSNKRTSKSPEVTSPTLADHSVEKLVVKTSTQKGGLEAGVGSWSPAPLSPINISLSQLCSLDYSQPEPEASHVPEALAAEDSGYNSRNLTEERLPGYQAGEGAKSCSHSRMVPDPRSPEPAVETSEFAEKAKESLNDSLEEQICGPTYMEPRSTEQRKSTDPVTSTLATSHSEDHATVQSINNSAALPQLRKQSPVKPQLGSLLSRRLGNLSRRIPLQLAVGNEPPGLYTPSQLHSLGVHPLVVGISVSNAVAFRFSGSHYFSIAVQQGSPVCVGDGAMLRLTKGSAGVSELWEAFVQSPGVDPKLVSSEWFANHYKWLVWKLAAMEVGFPCTFAGRCLTPDWLMLQLKCRYDREIDRAERPAIRKICEHDDVPSRAMALCVSRIDWDGVMGGGKPKEVSVGEKSSDTLSVSAVDSLEKSTRDDSKFQPYSGPACIELTDGWYSLPAVVDQPLRHMIRTGKIAVGTKLITYGAELVGDKAPSHPLEAPTTLTLKLSTNSTRRARWYARLGYQRSPRPFPVSLSSVLPDGGLVGCTEAIVARVYPMLYMEKSPAGGRNVFRNRRAEEKVGATHEAVRQRRIEAICVRVQREYEAEMDKQGEE